MKPPCQPGKVDGIAREAATGPRSEKASPFRPPKCDFGVIRGKKSAKIGKKRALKRVLLDEEPPEKENDSNGARGDIFLNPALVPDLFASVQRAIEARDFRSAGAELWRRHMALKGRPREVLAAWVEIWRGLGRPAMAKGLEANLRRTANNNRTESYDRKN